MKICYLVLVHHKFDQALRMVRRLAGPDCGFVLHIDAAVNSKVAAAFRAELESVKPVVYAQRERAQWGSYRQALAIMRCIQAALRMEPFDRYVLLSGQDYPIAGCAAISEFFTRFPQQEFIEALPQDVMDPAVPGWSPYFRFRHYHLWIGKRRLKLPLLLKGAPPLPVFHGSTWWALTRPAVVHVADQFELNGELRRYLRTGYLVDEVYIPTLIMASPLASNVSGTNVTFAAWTPTSGPHPKTLQSDDLKELLASRKLFARKFDSAVDESIMNQLDVLHAGMCARTSTGSKAAELCDHAPAD
jgi:hypothetical protein